MTKYHQAVTLHCASPGCPSVLMPDPRHVDNLTAGGGWLCRGHDYDEHEVPC